MIAIGTSWRAKAACVDEDTELFFASGNTGPAAEQTERAKAICAACEVRSECLDWAMTTGQQDGVWGGLSEDERRTLRRQRERRQRKRGRSDLAADDHLDGG